jgi:hypothetical protein
VPLTDAVNCWVLPVCSDAEVGEILIVTVGVAVTVTCADPDFVESATLVATTE